MIINYSKLLKLTKINLIFTSLLHYIYIYILNTNNKN